jgi:hypothetical protein
MADEQVLSESEKKKEDWMNSKWRPMMGWMYMAVCSFDFVLAPILWSLVQSLAHGSVQTQWQPLTLQGAGLFHISMGAVLGIAALGRTQEKLAGANNGGAGSSLMGTTYVPPTGVNNASMSSSNTAAFGAPASSGFGSSSFGSPSTPAPAFGSAPTPSFGSTPAPVPRPIPSAPAPTPINTSTNSGGFGAGLDPSDPPIRNTRNDL